jgi:hypothetical protein
MRTPKACYNVSLHRQREPQQTAAASEVGDSLRVCQVSLKSVIIEGFADRSEDGKRRWFKAAGSCGFVKNIQPISVGV